MLPLSVIMAHLG